MNEATLSTRPRFATLVGKMASWLFDPCLQLERGENFSYRTFRCKLGGGLFRLAIISFVKPDHSGIQLCFGIIRFHFDLDLFFIFRPEDEIRQDRRTNKLQYQDDEIDYHSWFLGYEGIGIYRKSSLSKALGISTLEMGAHPLFSFGITNVYHELTQHAIIGLQYANLQVSFHAAMDRNLQ
jgi:hypothetical protein